ncbi:MAG: methionyl-tRNA formyltransferase [Gemmatimonadales bacterium]|nr:methionyl-tRNA formyltransferase [Gemmatimonadales bacterium]
MRIVFFGTPDFAVPSLEALVAAHHTIVFAVTQPDRPRGRSRSNLVPPPVKARAESFAIPVLQPERPRGEAFEAALREARADLGVVVAYGHILKPEVLAIPRLGMINVHASLLPAWRGAGPIQAAIAAGDSTTGVTIMQMEAGLDSGPAILTRALPIRADETTGGLTPRLARLGAEALIEAVELLDKGEATFTIQDHASASYAPKVTRQSARIDWTAPAVSVANRIRAFDPAPGAWTSTRGSEVKLFRPELVTGEGVPGTVLSVAPTLTVAAGDGAVAIAEVQPSGRSRMGAAAWLRGNPIAPGDRLV